MMNARASPIISAATAVPSIWPSPAVAATAKERTIMSVPMPGTSDVVGEASAPPSAASDAPTIKVTRKTRLRVDADRGRGLTVFGHRQDDRTGKRVAQEIAQPKQRDHRHRRQHEQLIGGIVDAEDLDVRQQRSGAAKIGCTPQIMRCRLSMIMNTANVMSSCSTSSRP